MAGRGPAPKDPAKRRRRNAAEPETTITPDDMAAIAERVQFARLFGALLTSDADILRYLAGS
jgi:hypothetical protein